MQKKMIDRLHDNHGAIEPSDDIYDKAEQINIGDKPAPQLKEYGDFKIAGLVAKHYLKENLIKDSWIVK